MKKELPAAIEANPLLGVRACEGNCLETHGEHRGTVEKVLVTGNGWQPMTFYYCSNAVEEDEKRGFQVGRHDA